jgi:hypothetical protein
LCWPKTSTYAFARSAISAYFRRAAGAGATSTIRRPFRLDARGRIESIDGDTPSPAAVADAARYVKTLRDSGQLAATGQQQPAAGVTHQLERDEQGRQVLRRKRFSIS